MVTIATFVQYGPGEWRVAEPLPFRLGPEYHVVSPGLLFDSLTPLATSHLPLARLDLRDLAAANELEVEYGSDHLGRARAMRQSATLLNEALAAGGVPVLARARTWVVLSWGSVFHQLRATDVRFARRLRGLVSRHLLWTVSVSAMLVGLAVLPLVIGKLLPGIPFLDTAAGVGTTVLVESIAARIWRWVVQRRSSSPFEWL
jgi:hypothetical protein